MKRRDFIRHSAHAVTIPALLGPLGLKGWGKALMKKALETDKVLVLVYLQGGNDGLNTVVPLNGLSALNNARPHVILPENTLLPLPGTEVGLHPALTGFQSLFSEDRLRIIQSVGYPEQNYSHFRSTDIWMSGSDSDVLLTSGWAGRFLEQQYPGFPEGYPNESVTDPLSIEIGYGSTMLFQGPEAAMSMVLRDPTDFYNLLENVEEEVPDTYAGEKLRHIRMTAKQSQLYGTVVKQAADRVTTQQPYPETELAQQLKIVARLIEGGLKTPLYLVRINGFDTHDSQVEDNDHTAGEHADLLKELDDAVMAFMADLESHNVDDKVLGMTFSEFGRRIISNASSGTDHGAAAPLFLFGNNLEPGILGSNPTIPENATKYDNLPWEFDFRQIYSSVIQQWFEISEMESENILYHSFEPVQIIKSESSGPGTFVDPRDRSENFRVYPNPAKQYVYVESVTPHLLEEQLTVTDISGRKVSFQITRTGSGGFRLDLSGNPPGYYLIGIVVNKEFIQKKILLIAS